MSKFTVLLDCDGVIADYILFLLDYINQINKYSGKETNYTPEDIKQWSIWSSLPAFDKDVKKGIQSYIGRNARSLPLIVGAVKGVQELKKFCDVIILTAPYYSRTWVYDRNQWLQEHFGISDKDVIYASRKELIQGDIFVDDKVENILKWQKNNPTKIALLFSQPINKDTSSLSPEDQHIVESRRVQDWEDLLNKINLIKENSWKFSQIEDLKSKNIKHQNSYFPDAF